MNMRPFQIILLGIFFALALGGLIAFATFRGFGGEENPYGTRVAVWGTLDKASFDAVLGDLRDVYDGFDVVSYRQLDERIFQNELVNAIAEERGPDIVVLPNDLLISEREKLVVVPYESFPQRTFYDTYVEGAEIFLSSEGVHGIPLAVDPLVMYWNRPLLATRGLANPPTTWEELVAQTVPAVTDRTPSSEIVRSALAFGEYSNIKNAQEAILLLMLQSGSRLVTEQSQRGYVVELNPPSGTGAGSAEAALRFYTSFSNPTRSTYTWNRALPMDTDEFLAGDLALYFGFGSEREVLSRGNPNLNFDVAPVPQEAGAVTERGYGRFYSLAVPKSSQNQEGAFQVAFILGAPDVARTLGQYLDLAPVHRSVIAQGDSDPFRAVLLQSALIAYGWLDPSPSASENIFKQMIEDITSGRITVNSAVLDAQGRLRQLIN